MNTSIKERCIKIIEALQFFLLVGAGIVAAPFLLGLLLLGLVAGRLK